MTRQHEVYAIKTKKTPCLFWMDLDPTLWDLKPEGDAEISSTTHLHSILGVAIAFSMSNSGSGADTNAKPKGDFWSLWSPTMETQSTQSYRGRLFWLKAVDSCMSKFKTQKFHKSQKRFGGIWTCSSHPWTEICACFKLCKAVVHVLWHPRKAFSWAHLQRYLAKLWTLVCLTLVQIRAEDTMQAQIRKLFFAKAMRCLTSSKVMSSCSVED